MPLRAPTPPVSCGPSPAPPCWTVAGSSPFGTCHLMSPVFRSYAVMVVYGGFVDVAMTLYPDWYRVGNFAASTSSGHGMLPAVPPWPGYSGPPYRPGTGG